MSTPPTKSDGSAPWVGIRTGLAVVGLCGRLLSLRAGEISTQPAIPQTFSLESFAGLTNSLERNVRRVHQIHRSILEEVRDNEDFGTRRNESQSGRFASGQSVDSALPPTRSLGVESNRRDSFFHSLSRSSGIRPSMAAVFSKLNLGAGYIVPTDVATSKVFVPPTSTVEYGQRVNLAGAPVALQSVSFPYYSSVNQKQALTFSLYSVGSQGLPASLLYQSAKLDLGKGVYEVSISYASKQVPQDLIFSVAFSGLKPGDLAGLLVPGQGPTLGSTPGQVLVNNGTSWSVGTLPGPGSSAFSISITGEMIPEPSPVFLALIGGAGLLAFSFRRN